MVNFLEGNIEYETKTCEEDAGAQQSIFSLNEKYCQMPYLTEVPYPRGRWPP